MRIVFLGVLLCLNISCVQAMPGRSPLQGKKICIDAGHGGTAATDHYRIGVNGEREEWINLRVALLLKKMLEKKGALVIMTRTRDEMVELVARAELAVANKVDVFISIHHNATADRSANFPIIYYHGAASENIAGVEMGKLLAAAFHKYFYKKQTPVTLVSDYTIFPAKGASVLRNTYGIPGLLAEASFFTNEEEEKRLKKKKHNRKEAKAYLKTFEKFFSKPIPIIQEKKVPLRIQPFKVFEEAERMNPEALKWLEDFKRAEQLVTSNDIASLEFAFELFTLSARSFPDSYVAAKCHAYRSEILAKLNKAEESAAEKLRTNEFYVKLKL